MLNFNAASKAEHAVTTRVMVHCIRTRDLGIPLNKRFYGSIKYIILIILPANKLHSLSVRTLNNIFECRYR